MRAGKGSTARANSATRQRPGVSGLFGPSDYYDHHMNRERIHLVLLDDVKRGLADIAAGRTEDADTAIARLQQARKPATKASKTTKRRG
jgi:hypothetical protein